MIPICSRAILSLLTSLRCPLRIFAVQIILDSQRQHGSSSHASSDSGGARNAYRSIAPTPRPGYNIPYPVVIWLWQALLHQGFTPVYQRATPGCSWWDHSNYPCARSGWGYCWVSGNDRAGFPDTRARNGVNRVSVCVWISFFCLIHIYPVLQRSKSALITNPKMWSRNPCIEYLSVQELLQDCDLRDDNLAYNHIQIGHYRFLRNIHTKELYSDLSVASVPDASELLRRSSRIWENTAQCQALRAILMSRKDISISRIVGLALGSFATVYPSLQDRSAFQHALLLTLRDISCNMQNIAQQSIPCFAQDPMCNIVDITAAEEAGITILEDTDGFLEIDDSTVVFSCAPDIPVRQIVLDLARPAVLIWDKLRNEDDDDHSWVTTLLKFQHAQTYRCTGPTLPLHVWWLAYGTSMKNSNFLIMISTLATWQYTFVGIREVDRNKSRGDIPGGTS